MSARIFDKQVDVFWAEIAPCDHMVQFYENADVLVDSLDGFIGGGLAAGESAIVIATPVHLMLLERRLVERGLDLDELRENHRYVRLEAEQTLARFMRNGMPDALLFDRCVQEILAGINRDGRIRAFGEMVAVLWSLGQHGAVVALEYLWQQFCRRTSDLSLFCAFPKAGFTRDMSGAVADIAAAHSRVIGEMPVQ